MTRALLLSDEAEADNKPELEIFADDVTCGHGATTGALDESLLFYLRARGLSEKEAQALLIQAFVGEAIEAIVNDALRELAIAAAQRWLQARATITGGTNGSYDVALVREDFPALAMQVYGKPLVYLDNAASAQKPKAVLDRMTRPTRANTPTCIAACITSPMPRPKPMRAAAERSRNFINARRNEEIIFTRNVTEAINLVASSLGEPNIGEGDEIVISIMEHHSNIVPWHFHRERHGAVIKWAPVDDEGNFLIDEFEKLLTPRTKMVAITQMSNALGTIVPVKEVVQLAHARGIPVLVDGARARCIWRSTCRTSIATSTSSPATSCMGRPASACSTASTSTSWRCGRSTAAAR